MPRRTSSPFFSRMARLADAVEVRQAEFAEILTAENGKPIAQAVSEMAAVVAAMRYYSGQDIIAATAQHPVAEKPPRSRNLP
jgi:acyl-CoA reductase-like NAD-dependent aldehyde dehydrogenase